MGGKASIIEGLIKAIGAEAPAARSSIRAYHGTPHWFDKFEWSPRTRGTGEGAQAYGDGLYFAGNEKVARNYREQLAGPSSLGDASYGGVPIIEQGKPGAGWGDPTLTQENGLHPRDLAADVLRHGNVDDTVKAYRELSDRGLMRSQRMQDEKLRHFAERQAMHHSMMADFLEANPGMFDVKAPGHMYEVDINSSPDALLNWDATLSGQPEAVRGLLPSLDEARAIDAEMDDMSKAVLANRGDPEAQAKWDAAYRAPTYRKAKVVVNDSNPKLRGNGARGEDVYRALAASAPEASKTLLDAGVPGLRFLDGVSRSAGEGTHNYTIFDDSLIDIRRKYEDGGIVEGIRALHGDLPEQPQFGQSTAMKQMFMDRQIDDELRSAGINPQPAPRAAPPEEDIFAGANSPFADPGYTPPAATPSAIGAAAPQRDMPQNPAFGDDTRMRQMYLNRQIDADMAGMQRPSEPRRPSGGMSYAPELPAPPPPRMDDSGVRRPVAAYREPEAQIPIPRARPRPTSYAIREGDNPSKIAAMFGMSLKQLEKKNPGILKRSKRLKVGSEVVI